MSNEFDCEMDVNGEKIGDSKRKGYEGQIKCRARTPSIYTVSMGSSVVGSTDSLVGMGDLIVTGVIQNKGKLRSAAGLGKKTKHPQIKITRLRKLEGKAEDQVVQEITLKNAVFNSLEISEDDSSFGTSISYEEIEIKDHVIKADGSLDSPIVNSYNALTNVING